MLSQSVSGIGMRRAHGPERGELRMTSAVMKKALVALSVSLVIACTPMSERAATILDQTNYRPTKGFWTTDIDNSGYSEKQITASSWSVNVSGSAVTPPERVEEIALLRAAEIGKQNGFSHFRIADKKATVTCTGTTGGSVFAGIPNIELTASYANAAAPEHRSVDAYIAENASAVKSRGSSFEERKATAESQRDYCIAMRRR
jgi:hypothetical protein